MEVFKELGLTSKLPKNYDALCVIDFEATCEANQEYDLVQEIIEFPAFLVDTRKKKVVSSSWSYLCYHLKEIR